MLRIIYGAKVPLRKQMEFKSVKWLREYDPKLHIP